MVAGNLTTIGLTWIVAVAGIGAWGTWDWRFRDLDGLNWGMTATLVTIAPYTALCIGNVYWSVRFRRRLERGGSGPDLR